MSTTIKGGWNGLICASTQGPKTFDLIAEPCTGKACSNFENNVCTAGSETEDAFSKWLDATPRPPACPMADRCHWNVAALAQGKPACVVRRLGLICEHQANDENKDYAIWSTFDMADPDDSCWGEPTINTTAA